MNNTLDPEVRDLLLLQLIPGIGPRLTAALLERFGSASEVLKASAAELREVTYLGSRVAESIVQARKGVDVEAEIKLMEKHNVRLVAIGTPVYPVALTEIHDPPPLLYIRGTLDTRDEQSVALVGSRDCSDYGRRMATRLASDLARAGWTVVSGLARGIDGVSHRGALQAGGRTLAVLAGGLSRIYPPEHKTLAEEVEKSGAVISESRMGQESVPTLFPVRNRIISGLCRAVVIIEAPQKSGSLITATHAAEQGRLVFAVPGPADSSTSAGTNDLIRQGAILCRGVEDVLEELNSVFASPPGEKPTLPAVAMPPPAPPPVLDEKQKQVWEFLINGARHLDEMVQQLGLGVAQLSGMLLTMEMKRVVRRLPGNRYERC